MKNIKKSISMKNFYQLISLLEVKEEFNCTTYANGPGSCACRGPVSYCPNHSCNHAIVI